MKQEILNEIIRLTDLYCRKNNIDENTPGYYTLYENLKKRFLKDIFDMNLEDIQIEDEGSIT